MKISERIKRLMDAEKRLPVIDGAKVITPHGVVADARMEVWEQCYRIAIQEENNDRKQHDVSGSILPDDAN